MKTRLHCLYKSAWRVGVLLWVLLATGCYKMEDMDTPERAAKLTPSVYEALCRYWDRCREERLEYFPDADLERCIDYYKCYYRSFTIPVFNDSIACHRAITTASCNDIFAAVRTEPVSRGEQLLALSEEKTSGVSLFDIAPCRPYETDKNIVNDAVPQGGYCLAPYAYCKEGLQCRMTSPVQMVSSWICGVCEQPSQIGELCSEFVECDTDGYCDGIFCQRLGDVGQRCGDDIECQSGACVDGNCQQIGDDGSPCDSSDDCVSGHCDKRMLCSKFQFADLGEHCEQETSSVLVACDGDKALTCLDETCVPLSDVGQPCRTVDDCRRGLLCRDETCVDTPCVPDEGDECGGLFTECDQKTFCDFETERCVPRVPKGDLCRFQDDCKEGLFCDKDYTFDEIGVCTPLRKLGKRCTNAGNCVSGYCHRDDWSCEIDYANSVILCDSPECNDCGICTVLPPPVDECEERSLSDMYF